MRYPVAIEPGTETSAFGVVVPDLPGCFSAGDSLDEALTNAEVAAAAWIDATLDAGGVVPAPTSVDNLAGRAEYAEWIWDVIRVDPALLDESVERVNITLPRRVLARIDAKAKELGESRSSFIARMALG